MSKTIDITTLSGFSSLSAGTYAVGVKAHGTGTYTDSSMSATSNYTIYSITGTGTNCLINGSASYSGTIGQSQSVSLTITADGTSYKVPTSAPTIIGATGTYTRTSDTAATLVLSTPTGNVSFTVVGESAGLTELCFTANTAGSTVELTIVGSPSIANTAYSTDRVNWTTFTPSTTAGTNTITLTNVGDKVYFRNDITANLSSSKYMKFVMSGSISASGNINSMYDADGFNNLITLTYTYCYSSMFKGCTSLTTAPSLPATTLASDCYYSMFQNCTSLTTPPSLPATTLAINCYYSMFRGCTSFTTAPNLPATTLAIYCYENMFSGCTSLTTVPNLPATTLASGCYDAMFSGCTSLTTVPNLPATTLADSCYAYMFSGCTSLTTVPNLPATTLARGCYGSMFSGCASLYVSDTQRSEAPYEWHMPTSGTFTNTTTYNQSTMFYHCLSTRSSDDMSGALGESHTYYTQNNPV